VLYHVFDLPLHGDEEKHNKIKEQNWPEHRNVKYLEKSHAE
jgi:hypothetical protein